MERYIGLDAHAESCTLAVMGPSGKRLRELVVETDAKALVEAIRSIPGDKHLCMEEGELSQWLYETLEPHVKELVVNQPLLKQGNKSDSIDGWQLADRIRKGDLTGQVYKVRARFASLREATRAHNELTQDLVRSKNRLRGLFRSRGVRGLDASIYEPESRSKWLEQLPQAQRRHGTELGLHLDAVTEAHERVESWLFEEAERTAEVRRIATAPGIGRIRAAQIVAVVVSPHRFRTKRQFWSYCGLGLIRRSSSDWVRNGTREWQRKNIAQTRGLNRNRNPLLKAVFKGAARTVIDRMPNHPLHRDYQRLLDAGTKPNLARLTIARRIAAAVLAMWKRGEDYDVAKARKQNAA